MNIPILLSSLIFAVSLFFSGESKVSAGEARAPQGQMQKLEQRARDAARTKLKAMNNWKRTKALPAAGIT